MASAESLVENDQLQLQAMTEGEQQPSDRFKRRQYTPWTMVIFVCLGFVLAVEAIVLTIFLYSYQALNTGSIWLVVTLGGASLLMFVKGTGVRYCELEDLGQALRVEFGPKPGLFRQYASTHVRYDSIASFRDAAGCDNCGAYCVGVCCCCSLRGHALRSGNCKQRAVILTYKEERKVQGCRVNHISIAVSNQDYDAFMALLQEKCNLDLNANETEVPTTVI
mmetsp:Transcript_13592/g.21366  ORF Transcript_13592/g.21366 Transcript_13592/m.21366 type:complete len:222 (+) Transcript_13592:88-753(+)